MTKIAKQIILIYLIFTISTVFLRVFDVISVEFVISSLIAAFLNLINIFTAIKLFEKSYTKSNITFIKYNLGGLGIRIFMLLVAFLLIIKFLNIDKYAFILVFFLFYIILMIIEVMYFIYLSDKRKRNLADNV